MQPVDYAMGISQILKDTHRPNNTGNKTTETKACPNAKVCTKSRAPHGVDTRAIQSNNKGFRKNTEFWQEIGPVLNRAFFYS